MAQRQAETPSPASVSEQRPAVGASIVNTEPLPTEITQEVLAAGEVRLWSYCLNNIHDPSCRKTLVEFLRFRKNEWKEKSKLATVGLHEYKEMIQELESEGVENMPPVIGADKDEDDE